MRPGVVGFSTTSFPLPTKELKTCSEYLLSRVTSSSEDMPGSGRARRLTVFSWAAVMLCNRFDIHGVRMTTSSQVILDPGSRPGFMVLKMYSAKHLWGTYNLCIRCHRHWTPHLPRTAVLLTAISRLFYSYHTCPLRVGSTEMA